MVFESVVVELLNRFLGDYVENLDSKQLKIGIWGGDVELKDLVLKQTALKELDLPIQTVYGRLGKLVLKIPWKNLYYSPVVADIEGLYILTEPNTQVQYTAEKEEKRTQDAKQAELRRVEEAKKKALAAAKEKVDDSFVEKLTTQIIRNVQISIRDIHVRYEDEGYMVGRPFAAGFTLSNLSVQTTDENWVPAVIYENIAQIFKIVELEGLAVYWNCKCELYKTVPSGNYNERFKNDIATKTAKPNDYRYILGPINSCARLILNQKPELDVPAFKTPKAKVNVEMEKLAVGITKSQFRDVVALADCMNLMMVGSVYRKHRPKVPSYKGHYKEWWHFAYNCILEFEVRRRHKNWDWMHMNKHRKTCKEYAELYKTKLQSKKCPENVSQRIADIEMLLDVLNIVLVRQRVELEVEKVTKRQTTDASSKSSWFGWWRHTDAAADDTNSNTLVSQFQAAMTAEEKERLFKAIDYREHAGPAEYPEEFVAVSCTFVLKILNIEVVDDEKGLQQILNSDLCSVKCKIEMRPTTSALSVHVNIDHLSVFGIEQQDVVPQVVTSKAIKDGAFLDFLFETNPLHSKYTQRLYVTVKPIRVVYDAQTVISVASCFVVPSSSAIEQLSAVTASTLNDVKVKSAAGLQHAIDTHSLIEVKIDLHAPIIILPYGGLYTETENVLVANLGRVKITSVERKRMDIRQKQAVHVNEDAILKALLEESYDEFVLEFTELQVLLVPGGEDWLQLITESKSTELHLLNPTSLHLSYSKCLVQDDHRLPQHRITGTLPSLTLNAVDSKLILLLGLIHSIPFPTDELPPAVKLSSTSLSRSSTVLMKYLDTRDKSVRTTEEFLISEVQSSTDFVQFTKLELNFVMKELSVALSHQEYSNSPIEQVAVFRVSHIECDVVMQTYTTDVTVRLAYIEFHKNHKDDIVEIISTPICSVKGAYLFVVKFLMVNRRAPDFYTKHRACETQLELQFAMLKIVLHQQVLQELIQFASDLQVQLEEITGPSNRQLDRLASSGSSIKRGLSSISLSKLNVQQSKKDVAVSTDIVVETIIFRLGAKLTELLIVLANDERELTSFSIKGINTEIVIKKPYTHITAQLQDLLVVDLNPETKHPNVVHVLDREAINVQVVLYNTDIVNKKRQEDVLVTATLGRMRIVFLNLYVSTIIDFVNRFQAAQAAIVEASHVAAERAKQNVANVYANAIRISLDVNLKAPDIIVPENSSSYDAILVVLGQLTISNELAKLELKNEMGQQAVIDSTKLALTEVKVSRIKMDDRYNVVEDITILKPLTFSVTLKRNLSTSWYTAVPDVYAVGQIASIELVLGQPDYKMIMATINGNLSEAVRTDVDPKKDQSPKVVLTRKSVAADRSSPQIVNLDSDKKEDIPPEEKVHIMAKFNFIMEKFVISLLTIEPYADPHSFNCPRCGLATFSLEGLSIKGRVLTDGTINTSVLLVNCVLEDIRKDSEKALTRLLERKIEEELVCESRIVNPLAYKSMIDVTFKKKNNDIYVDLRISSFRLILSMEFLSKIQHFFTVALEHVAKPEPGALKPSAPVQANKMAAPADGAASDMTVNIKIEKPDIVLVEHMNTIDTNALILNCEAILKYSVSGKHQVVSGTVKDIMLYTCCYNPEKRAGTMATVLHPFTVSIAGTTPAHKGLHIEVCLTNIYVSVSPATIDLLNRSYVTMFSGEEGNVVSQEDVHVDRSNLWRHQPFGSDDFWFLRAESAIDAWELFSAGTESLIRNTLTELCMFTIPSVVISVEAGIGNKTLPMLLIESELHGKMKNWSSKLEIEATLTLQMGYYNSGLAVWEPLLEPVVEEVGMQMRSRPWSLKLEVSMNDEDEDASQSPPEDSTEPRAVEPKMRVELTSDSNLEVTFSKAGLEVLTNLGKAFSAAVKADMVKQQVEPSPYKFKNETGIPITVCLARSDFELSSNVEAQEVVLESGAVAPLQLMSSLISKTSLHLEHELDKTYKSAQHKLCVKIPEIKCELELNIVRADKRYFSLNYRGDNKDDNWGLILSTVVDNGVIVMTLSSIVRVHNNFDIPIDVYYMTARGDELECTGSVEPGSYFNVPLKAVYTQTCELFFSTKGYCVTSTPFVWKDLKLNLSQTQMLQSSPKSELSHKQPFVFKVIGEIEQVYNENSVKFTMLSTMYNINLNPAVLFRNSLPVDVVLYIQDIDEETYVNASDMCIVPNVNPGCTYVVIRIPNYLEKEWSCKHDIASSPPQFSVWTFDSYDGFTKMSLDLGMHVLPKNGSSLMSLYCPFWMLNKTGMDISYRKSRKTERNEASGSPIKNSDENLNIIHHPHIFKGPVLFSFNAKNFFGKKKASVRLRCGEWSDKFSIDVAGSSGVVMCKENEMFYQLGVNIQLTYNGLTKQVTFTPYYVIINDAPFAIECQEHERAADPWTVVEPKSCSSFWPRGDYDDKLLKLRIVGTEEVSASFLVTESHTSLLKLENKYGGVNVDIQITEGAIYINLAKYEPGMAPALIINHTRDTLNIWERDTVQLRKLDPSHQFLYTWDYPAGQRVLVWEAGNKEEIQDDLRKDGAGEYSVAKDNYVYWVSFLDGMQRVLLFTQDEDVAKEAQSSKQFEQIDQEVTISIHGLGLSLVNNAERTEIMYIGIAPSGVIWETCKESTKHGRFKQMNVKDSNSVEDAYQAYLKLKEEDPERAVSRVSVDAKIEVDFELNVMYKPHKKVIKRTFLAGLWVQMRSNSNLLQLHTKINRLQIDNQMHDCIFPVVLAPVPPPKSVALVDIHKPFAELSIVQLLIKHSQIKQFKYFKVLIQEFHIKLDIGFVNAVLSVLQGSTDNLHEEKTMFLKDMQLVDSPLYTHVSSQSLQEQKSFYDLLHFSPLKIHVSFTMASGSSTQGIAAPNVINVLLQGLGVTLTDLQDVVFKLAYFEKEYSFLTQKQLTSEATSHYVGQAVKQLYVLVLGLDVLGNPYGLVLGITKGVEDLFYEPFQGAIQGPGEFAEGLGLGIRSLFGHTVGGAAGAVSRITGAMGKGLATLTFDKDYQKKRRDQINMKPQTVPEGLARSGKGLVMGVYDGVTGVFRKPISGAKEHGVGGFFKGLGKGAVGLVTRPTAGVMDFASSSLDTVKRVTEMSAEEAHRLRPPRFIHPDGLIRPYNFKESMGYKLLAELDKGKYASTDNYMTHFVIIAKKEMLLLTDRRLAYVSHNDLFGGWQMEWAYTWSELTAPPKVVPKGVLIAAGEGRRRKGLFGAADTGKTILVSDPNVCEEICKKIKDLQNS